MVVGVRLVWEVGHLACKYHPRPWQSAVWAWRPPTAFAEVALRLELDFYFRFVKIDHFRFELNGVRVKVLPHGVRGGVPYRGIPRPRGRLPKEMDFLKYNQKNSKAYFRVKTVKFS